MAKKFPVLGEKIPEKFYREVHRVLPLVCTDVIVVGGKSKKFFLLVKRKNEPEKGKWWFPGGRILKNELLADAALRKVKQETGLRGKNPRQLGVYEYFSPVGYYQGTSSHMIAIDYSVEVNVDRKVILDWQSSDSKWFSRIDPRWDPYVKTFLRKAGFK